MTTTPTGAQYLFYLLKHPVFEKRILDNREELINAFSNNPYNSHFINWPNKMLNICLTHFGNHCPKIQAMPEFFPFLSFIALASCTSPLLISTTALRCDRDSIHYKSDYSLLGQKKVGWISFLASIPRGFDKCR